MDKKTYGKLFLLVTFGILLYATVQNFNIILSVVNFILGISLPFILGGAMAFIFNVAMKPIEHAIFGKTNARLALAAGDDKPIKKPTFFEKRGVQRGISLVLTIIAFTIAILFITMLILPELVSAVSSLAVTVPNYIDELIAQLANSPLEEVAPEIIAELEAIEIDWNEVWNAATSFFKSGAIGDVLNSTFGFLSGVFSGVFNGVVAIVFAIYILTQKEELGEASKKLMYAFMGEAKAQRTLYVLGLTNRSFTSFIKGQCIEAVILGLLTFVMMSIFSFPYAVMVSATVSLTALIPIFGGFIGAGVGAFMILTINPIQALSFLIAFIILQQIEGNVIYPKVVGGSIGLPPIWVLVAVTFGGATMGIVGMLLFIPLFSVAFALIKEETEKRLSVN